jgi:RNA polymerase sigma factor (sigma-70 family)
VAQLNDESMTDGEIQDLMDRLRAGDQTARDRMFAYVVERFRPLAHKLLRVNFPNVALYAETDDILHDALCRLIPYLARSGQTRGTSRGQFHTLTATVLRHTLIDLARKYFGSVRGQPITDGLQASHPLLQQSSGLEAWREEIRVHEMVERLPDAERAVIELSLYMGYGATEIAKCLGIHPGNVSRRMASAKEKLGRMLRLDDSGTE